MLVSFQMLTKRVDPRERERERENPPYRLSIVQLLEGVQGLRALHGDDATVGSKLESQPSTLSALVKAGVAARDDADSAGYERADREDDQHNETEEDDDAVGDGTQAADAEAAGYASVSSNTLSLSLRWSHLCIFSFWSAISPLHLFIFVCHPRSRKRGPTVNRARQSTYLRRPHHCLNVVQTLPRLPNA